MRNHDPVNSNPLSGSQLARSAPTALSFRNFQPSDSSEVVKLLSIGRPSSYLDLKSAIFDWQFLQNPHSDGRSPFLVGTVGDGRIVALNGFMPARIRFHNQPMLASWSCDTYVSPDHRGQGFGKQLVKLVSDAAPIMLGYGISDMSDPIFHKYDWVLNPNIVLLFCHVAEPGIAGRIKNFGSELTRSRRTIGRSRVCSRDLACEDHEQFLAEVDELWNDSRSGYVSTVERDAAYLNWKYYQHPLNHYISYSVRSQSGLQGLMIARHDPEESVIADYCGPADDASLMRELASAAVEDLAQRKTIRIRCETTHPPMVEALKGAGFLASRHVSRFRVRSNTSESDILAGWFLMTGDSDNDLLPGLDAAALKSSPDAHP